MHTQKMQIKLFLSLIPLVCFIGTVVAVPVNDLQACGVGDALDDGIATVDIDLDFV